MSSTGQGIGNAVGGDFNQLGHAGLNTPSGTNAGNQGISGVQNERGQGLSHTTDPNASKVPSSVQQKVPKSVEESLPDKVHPTEGNAGKGVSHATGKSIVPQKLQEKLPEKIERAVPNAIHDTSDKSGLGGSR